MVNFVTNVLLPGDQSVCVFTHQRRLLTNLILNNNGISSSGIWKLNQLRMMRVNKVVVYYRHNGINEIIVGNYNGISPSNVPGRYYINFQITNRDDTPNNWNIFCKTGTNPVKYFP